MSALMKLTLQHVTARKNRDGTLRHYFFRRGQPLTRLPGEPNSPEFMHEYQKCLHPESPAFGEYRGSFEWLCDQYMDSPAFRSKADATRTARRRVIASMMKEPLERGKPERFGQEQAAHIGLTHIEILRDRKADNPNAANERLKILAQVFKFAKRKPNPVRDVERLAVPKGGHRTATDDDIAAYEAKHTSGAPRLAMTLLKNFGPRVSDLRLLGRHHVKDGRLCFTTVKTGMLCQLAIGSVDLPRDRMTFLLTEEGAAFASDKAMSARVAKWFRQAGVRDVTAHGVRKWLATKMANEGSSEHELMAWFGWRDAKEARPYTQAADRRKLADQAGQRRGNV